MKINNILSFPLKDADKNYVQTSTSFFSLSAPSSAKSLSNPLPLPSQLGIRDWGVKQAPIRERNASGKQGPLNLAKGTSPLGGDRVERINSFNTVFNLQKNNIIKRFLGQDNKPAPNIKTIMHYNTKSVVYSYRKVNNIYPLLTKTEYLLKSMFRSMFSLISKPIYLIRHDKIIIRLFVYLSPKIDKYLDTSTTGINYNTSSKQNVETQTSRFAGAKTVKVKTSTSPAPIRERETLRTGPQAGFSANVSGLKLRNFLKFKSLRPNAIEILKSQIQIKSNSSIYRLNPLLSLSSLVQHPAPPIRGPIKGKGLEGEAALPKVKPCGRKSVNLLAKSNIGESNYINNYPYSSIISNFKINLEKLSFIFSKLFNKKVEFEIIKAQLPFQDSNVLAQILGYNANKYKFRQMLKILIPRAVIKNPSKKILARDKQSVEYKDIESLVNGTYHTLGEGLEVLKQKLPMHASQSPKGNIISYLSGMNIKLAGRLMTQSMRPRFTEQSLQEGSLARVKVHYIEKSRFTSKNKRGAFSFTITISHVFN